MDPAYRTMGRFVTARSLEENEWKLPTPNLRSVKREMTTSPVTEEERHTLRAIQSQVKLGVPIDDAVTKCDRRTT